MNKLNFEKIIANHVREKSIFYKHEDVILAMKIAVSKAIPEILEYAADNAEIKTQLIDFEQAQVWVGKESITGLEEEIKTKLGV